VPRLSSSLSPAEIKQRQAEGLGWAPKVRIATPREAERFVERYGVVLRYTAPPSVLLASLRAASGPADNDAALETSIHLTNHILGRACGIEVNVVAGRLTIVHRDLMPALYRLVRRDRAPDDLDGLSLAARTAYALIREEREVAAGDVRRRLGVKPTPRHDPAYEALAELQRHLLVDRGPFVVPKTGIPYLSREGYPYHLFHEAHADLMRAAKRLDRTAATDAWLAAYISGVTIAARRTLASLFRLFLTPAEIDASIDRLVATGSMKTVQNSVVSLGARRARRNS
jgi:hypothetical protein